MRKITVAGLLVLTVFAQVLLVNATEQQIIAGAGPSTKVVETFVALFSQQPSCQGIQFEVPSQSVKHSGGIKCSDQNLFGRTGRPLTLEEKQLNKDEIFLAKVPIAFVVGVNTGISKLSVGDLERIYTRQVTNWSQVGGTSAPIVLVGREPTEALFLELKEQYPAFRDVKFDVILNRDNHVIPFMQTDKGATAIAFGAKPNFSELNVIEVSGLSAGVRLGLVYDKKNQDNPIVKAAKDFAASPDWQNQVSQLGLIAIN